MCGVACIVAPIPRSEREALCAEMVLALGHRGPDGQGLWSAPLDERSPDGPGITLGHRRLAIVDPTPGGAQPMQRGALVLSWNGEVYNHRALRARFKQEGAPLSSDSDSEVLLTAVAKLGPVAALQEVTGPLAMLLWDGQTRTIHLARDRFGKKQLYVYRHGEFLLVASEPKALVPVIHKLGLPLHVDRLTLARYLADVEQEAHDATFFAQIRRVGPAELQSFALPRRPAPIAPPTISTYYQLRPDPAPPSDQVEFQREFRQRLCHALDLRLDCDGTVGALLSGGMDSSALVCLSAVLGHRLPTFSAVHRADDPCDESVFIDAVQSHTGVENFRIIPETQLSPDAFARFVYEQDEPTGGASVFAQACVFRLVRSHGIKVVISGQGADEALTGYGGAIPWLLADHLRHGHLTRFAQELWASKPSPGQAMHALAQSGWLAFRDGLPASLQALLLARKWQRSFHTTPFFRLDGLGLPDIVAGGPLADEFAARSLLHGYLYRLLSGSSLLAILRTEDRSSMAQGVESRAPFLDHRVVELCMACPPDWLVTQGRTKALLRESLSDVLPGAIANRRDKIGFGAPEARYLQGPLRPLAEEYLSKSCLGDEGLVDLPALHAAFHQGPLESRPSHALWKLISVEQWLRTFGLSL